AIGSDAFSLCESLETINLPEGVVSIGGFAFRSCKALKSITFPKSLTSIGQQAFNGSGLTSVEIPDGVTSLPDYAFGYCFSLTSVKLPKNLKSIGAYAFHMDPITSIELSNTLTSIGKLALACTKLTKVVIPNSVTSISSFAFDRCEDLKSVVLPAKLANLENNVFRSCTSLTSVVLPPSLTKIGGRAFMDCSALDTVYLGANIAEIGDSAFYNNKLRNLYITRQTKVPTVGGKSFYTSSSSARTLYVQGTSAKTSFGTTWNGFTTATMTTPGGLKDYTGAATTSFSSTKSSALPYQEGTTTAQVSASFTTAAPSIPYVFYTSSDPAKLYVDNEGRITVASSYKVTDGVTITAETLYYDGPKITYTPSAATLTYSYNSTAKTATVTGASDKNITSVDIPQTVTNGGVTYTVTTIGRGAFGNTDTSNNDA
ncbi:MAG: leucine-rich repeat domain-containing protein, partial [Muribaculaceae bacterium]|nr:leucine-rich repeat domain-containing protein [Muribaculaceae bacterium]